MLYLNLSFAEFFTKTSTKFFVFRLVYLMKLNFHFHQEIKFPQYRQHRKNRIYVQQLISSLFENIVDQMVFELYFESHMKELEIDVFKNFNFPDISILLIDSEKSNAIIKSWYWLQEKENPIRNKILVSNSRSWIIKRINQTVNQQ